MRTPWEPQLWKKDARKELQPHMTRTEVLISPLSCQCFLPIGETQMKAADEGSRVVCIQIPLPKAERGMVERGLQRQAGCALFMRLKASALCTACKALYTFLTVRSLFNLSLIFLLVPPPNQYSCSSCSTYQAPLSSWLWLGLSSAFSVLPQVRPCGLLTHLL